MAKLPYLLFLLFVALPFLNSYKTVCDATGLTWDYPGNTWGKGDTPIWEKWGTHWVTSFFFLITHLETIPITIDLLYLQ
jgi:hypothetical protein